MALINANLDIWQLQKKNNFKFSQTLDLILYEKKLD